MTPYIMIINMLFEILEYKCSVLLGMITWPIALILISMAIIKRLWHIGTVYDNISHLVSDDTSIMDPLLKLSATEISYRIRDPHDKLTSLTMVELCIQHIKKVNPFLRAVVATRYRDARKEAMKADQAVADGTVPHDAPFWGVPILVKECFEIPGMPYTAGIYGRKGVVGSSLAPALQNLQKHGGAIILGTTNVSEACMYHESSNHVYGTTMNPYDFRRTAGGSSGGCGAAVAACCAPFAVTSDVGGSTRIPALYNGLFGHKPTGGAVSNDNCMPCCGTGDIQRYCQLGPTSKHAEDLWPLLQCLMGKQPNSQLNSAVEETFDPKNLEVYVLKRSLPSSLFSSSIHADILRGIDKTAAHLQSLGATVRYDIDTSLELQDMFTNANAFQIWAALMSHHKSKPFSKVIREGLDDVWLWPLELIKSLFDLSYNTFPAVGLAVLEAISDMKFMSAENSAMRAMGMRLKKSLHSFLAPEYVVPKVASVEHAPVADSIESELESTPEHKNINTSRVKKEKIILMPSLPTPAPFHGESIMRILDTANTGFFNVMELPATAVPLGLERSSPERQTGCRMPVGIQVIGGHGRDKVTIDIAVELQKAGIAKWEAPVEFNHDLDQ